MSCPHNEYQNKVLLNCLSVQIKNLCSFEVVLLNFLMSIFMKLVNVHKCLLYLSVTNLERKVL